MATFLWSALTNGQVITGFDVDNDILSFTDAAISAADLRIDGNDEPEDGAIFTSLSFGGKTVTIGMSPIAAATSNIVFADGSRLLVGDNSTGTANDDGANTLIGGDGDDQFVGLAGADSMVGNGGNDVFTMFPSAGNPDTTIDDPTWGNDTIRGGSGTDRIVFPFLGNDQVIGVNVNLAAGIATGGDGPPVSTLTLFGIENVDGTALADVITGSSAANVLMGNGGNDVLDGKGGADKINGGAGNDTITWGKGDTINGAGGTDTLKLGVNLNLVSLSNTKITNIEAINMVGGGNDTLTLGTSDVLALSSTTNTVKIKGDTDDVVNIDIASLGTPTTSGGFMKYQYGSAILLIESDVNVV